MYYYTKLRDESAYEAKESIMKTSLTLLVGVILAAGAFAETHQVSAILDHETTNWNRSVQLEQFDPSLGILTSVAIQVEGSLEGSFQHELTGEESGTWSDFMIMTLNVSVANQWIIGFDGAHVANGELGSFDGVLDFAGTSGETYDYAIPISGGTVRTSGFEAYLGDGAVSVQLVSQAMANMSQTGSGTMVSTATCGGTVTLTYDYSPATIPNEDTSWSAVKALYR